MTLIYPLVDVDPANLTQGGYDYLEWVGDAFHPGIDLNTPGGAYTDLGTAVVAPVDGVVRVLRHWDGETKGFGTHCWVETVHGPWLHFAHLQHVLVPAGTWLTAGAVFCLCGGSGGWVPHLHFEVLRRQPPSWEFWPKWRPAEEVAALYLDPIAWLMELAMAETAEEGDDVTDAERNLVELHRAIGITREGVELLVSRNGRTVELGRELRDSRRLPTRRRKAIGAELAAYGD